MWLVEGCAVSAITQAELFYGTERSTNPAKSFVEVTAALKEAKAEVIAINGDIVKIWAREKVKLEKRGEKIEDFDLLIAATALSLDLELVTRNVRHFERVKGLRIFEGN